MTRAISVTPGERERERENEKEGEYGANGNVYDCWAQLEVLKIVHNQRPFQCEEISFSSLLKRQKLQVLLPITSFRTISLLPPDVLSCTKVDFGS